MEDGPGLRRQHALLPIRITSRRRMRFGDLISQPNDRRRKAAAACAAQTHRRTAVVLMRRGRGCRCLDAHIGGEDSQCSGRLQGERDEAEDDEPPAHAVDMLIRNSYRLSGADAGSRQPQAGNGPIARRAAMIHRDLLLRTIAGSEVRAPSFTTATTSTVPGVADRDRPASSVNVAAFAGSAASRSVVAGASSIAGVPPRSSKRPTAVTTASRGAKPFVLTISRKRSMVTAFPGFNLMSATARSSETSTDSTPSSFCTATLTAWAQTVQSMPKIVISMRRNSADATRGSIENSASRRSSRTRAMGTPLSEPEEVAEIHGKPEAFTRLEIRVLKHRKQHAAFDAIRLV